MSEQQTQAPDAAAGRPGTQPDAGAGVTMTPAVPATPIVPSAAGTDVEAVLARATFDDRGLLPAVIQQHDTREVLMVGWMDAEALRRTYTTGRVTFWSRSRQEYWRKGDTSGHAQYVTAAALDCDGDTLLVEVDQVGVACHTGTRTCFDGDRLTPVRGEREGVARDDSAPGNSARHDCARDDCARHDSARHDSATHGSAQDDTAHNDTAHNGSTHNGSTHNDEGQR